MLWLLLVPLAAAHPATTPVPDATTPALREVWCAPAALSCWSRGQLPVADGRCAEPLSRGPCGEGEWLTLDARTPPSVRAPLRARCVPRPCPDAAQLPVDDGRCLAQDDARAALCGGRAVYLDPRGVPRCGDFPGWTSALSSLTLCVEPQATTTAVGGGAVNCAHHNRGDCVKEVVASTTGRLVIESEDK